jgi:hypothetical protein
MKYITNITGEIKLPWEPGLLEWLQEQYPYSKYCVVEEHQDEEISQLVG